MNIAIFLQSNKPRALFLLIVASAVIFGVFSGAEELNKIAVARQKVPFSFYGDAFIGLAEALKGETYLGYYTDVSIDVPKYGARFAQVQLALAPLILDLNNTSRRFVLFDCDNPQKCVEKIKEIKARPLKASNRGTILAITTAN
ncbi:MAG: hypothetical protein HQL16_06560 [Candidatus Omnitrophica bacterium]|nr:hypothetical protein [Candidatus Omnitrophota bacterium]